MSTPVGASPAPLPGRLCHRHRVYWLASCTDCRAERRAALDLLRSA